MKLLALLFVVASAGRLHAGVETVANPGIYIVSPDHPATWEVGFNDKVGQNLRWSENEGKLLLDVTYSRITYTYSTQPDEFKTYTLSFPNVLQDKDGNYFVLTPQKKRIIIGCRTSGPFGEQVSLNKGVYLSAHRRNGRIDAVLVARNAR